MDTTLEMIWERCARSLDMPGILDDADADADAETDSGRR